MPGASRTHADPGDVGDGGKCTSETPRVVCRGERVDVCTAVCIKRKGKEKQNYGKVPPWIVRFNRMVRAWMWEGSAGSFKVFFFVNKEVSGAIGFLKKLFIVVLVLFESELCVRRT